MHTVFGFDLKSKKIYRLVGERDKHGFSGDYGPASKAQLFGPTGLACDAKRGRIFVADSGNGCVRVLEGWFDVKK
jgi:hypothetical protein